MKKKVVRLTLQRETLRILLDVKLAGVGGGMSPLTENPDGNCYPTVKNLAPR